MTDVKAARHEWYQTDSDIIISVFIKGAKDVSVDITADSLTVTAKLDELRESQLSFEPLFAAVDQKQSSHRILSTKIEIKLRKVQEGVRWDLLVGNSTPLEAALGYPSSSKKKSDWNALNKNVEEEKEEGDKALNSMFQDIFKNGSDDTKKAMMKSFQESGGTSLSTNWNEVGKGRVQITPPEGMVAKPWSGN